MFATRVAQPTRLMPANTNWTENTPIAAAIDGVLEISLIGLADLTFWQDKLRPAGLSPTKRDGRAECLISATSAKFHGVCFRELSFSVFVTNEPGGATRDAAYMAYAFNSLRLFAWIERTLFSTPYFPAQLEVSLSTAARIVAHSAKQPVLQATMSETDGSPDRSPLQSQTDGWSGPIYLPPLRTGGILGEKLFYAQLQGETHIYAFAPILDRFQLTPLASQAALHDFRESGFEPREWHIRPSAQHAKTKTVRRNRQARQRSNLGPPRSVE